MQPVVPWRATVFATFLALEIMKAMIIAACPKHPKDTWYGMVYVQVVSDSDHQYLIYKDLRESSYPGQSHFNSHRPRHLISSSSPSIHIYITMKSFIAAAALATLASVAEAKKCQNITVPVTIEARLGMFGDLAPQNDIDITNFILNLAQQGKNFTEASLKGVSISFRSIAGNHSQLTIPI